MTPNHNAMKLIKPSRISILAFALMVITATGCKHTPVGPTPIPGNRGIKPTNPDAYNNNQAPKLDQGTKISSDPTLPIEQGPSHVGWIDDPSTPLRGQTIYFDFDKTAIKASEHPKLDFVVTYLREHPNVALRVEGNCDERGTEEYNRSLGSRRALAGREYFVGQGIDPTRVDTVSYGEDKPAIVGHDEAAFSKNRRDEFIVLLPPPK
jgi:peptidoglycan-associated lipoprotein